MPDGERRAEGSAGVTRRGLDPEVLEDPLPQQHAVGHAVQGDAPGHAQVALAGDLPGVAGELEDDLLGDVLDRLREVHLALGDRRLGAAGRTPEQRRELAVGHLQAVEVAEVVHVHPERAVLPDVDQLPPDGVRVPALAVGREAHQLVLARVHPETGEVGEGRVEEPQGVREGDLAEELELVPLAHADGGGRPLAHAVEGQHGRLLEGRGVEGRRRVRLVVLGEEDLPGLADAALLQRVLDLGRDPQLLAQPEGHGHDVRAQPLGDDREIGLEDAVELEQRLVVEDDPVELPLAHAPLRQAVADGVEGELVVMLLAGEPLFLGGGDDAPAVDQAGGRIVVVAADAEQLHG